MSPKSSNSNIEENFLLKEEILQCIESLSAKCLSQQATVKLDTKHLPEKLSGDVANFRLSINSVSEFALTCCKEGAIEITVSFAGMSQDKQYLIGFDFKFSRYRQCNDETVVKLLNLLKAGDS